MSEREWHFYAGDVTRAQTIVATIDKALEDEDSEKLRALAELLCSEETADPWLQQEAVFNEYTSPRYEDAGS